jgi:hypothetical protein
VSISACTGTRIRPLAGRGLQGRTVTARQAEANMKSIYCWVCIIALLAFGIGVKVGRHYPPGFGVLFVRMFQHNSPGAMDWMFVLQV